MVRIETKDDRMEDKENKQDKILNSYRYKIQLSFRFQNCLIILNFCMPELILGNIGPILFMMA